MSDLHDRLLAAVTAAPCLKDLDDDPRCGKEWKHPECAVSMLVIVYTTMQRDLDRLEPLEPMKNLLSRALAEWLHEHGWDAEKPSWVKEAQGLLEGKESSTES